MAYSLYVLTHISFKMTCSDTPVVIIMEFTGIYFPQLFLWNTLYRQPSKHESSVSSFNFSQKSVISSGFVKNNRTKLKQVSFWSYCHMSSTLPSVFFIILFACIHDTEIKTQQIYLQNPLRVRQFFSDCHFQKAVILSKIVIDQPN